MQDRPTADELLLALERFLDEDIVPNTPGSRGFHARVAANTVRILRRELNLEEEALRNEWKRLNTILGVLPIPDSLSALRTELLARNSALCELIRGGGADTGNTARIVFEHARRTVADKLAVSNPELLARSRDA